MSNVKGEIVEGPDERTFKPEQLGYQSPHRRRRNEWQYEYEYNPLKAYDDFGRVSCHRDKPR